MKLKSLIAAVAACVMVAGGALPVSAADNLNVAGKEYVLVGKGAEGHSIVMDLAGKSEAKAVYYPVTSVKMSKPDFLVEVEDVENDDDLKVKVVYNSGLSMYGIEITAKDLMDTSFLVKYLQKSGPNYQAIAISNVELMVIDGDDHLPDPDRDKDDDDDDEDDVYKAYRAQAGATNVLEGLKACADGQSLVVDISDNNRVPNSWLKTLKNYPKKTLIFTGEDYSWTVKGSDVKSISSYLSHYVGVSRTAENQAELEEASGIKNIRPVVISGMSKFPAKATLKVQLQGQAYKEATVNVYRYENGKVVTIAENVETDGDGYVSFPVTKSGTYLVSQLKSSKAV